MASTQVQIGRVTIQHWPDFPPHLIPWKTEADLLTSLAQCPDQTIPNTVFAPNSDKFLQLGYAAKTKGISVSWSEKGAPKAWMNPDKKTGVYDWSKPNKATVAPVQALSPAIAAAAAPLPDFMAALQAARLGASLPPPPVPAPTATQPSAIKEVTGHPAFLEQIKSFEQTDPFMGKIQGIQDGMVKMGEHLQSRQDDIYQLLEKLKKGQEDTVAYHHDHTATFNGIRKQLAALQESLGEAAEDDDADELMDSDEILDSVDPPKKPKAKTRVTARTPKRRLAFDEDQEPVKKKQKKD